MTISNGAPSEMGSRTLGTSASAASTGEAHTAASAVSWGAIFAGAAGAAALSLILLILGTGLGLSSVSPWTNQGASATTVGLATILWLTFTQLAASGMGGYLAGRLRTRWASVHTDEVYFRDTAHGFLAWSVATLVTAAMLSSAIGSIVGGGVQAGASVASGLGGAASGAATAAAGSAAGKGAGSASGDTANGYFLDSLFRKDAGGSGSGAAAPTPAASPASDAAPSGAAQPAMAGAPNASSGATGNPTPGDSAATTAEVGRIFMNSIGSGALPADDTRYVGQLVARSTGLSQQDAEKRVTDTYTRLQTKLRDTETAARDAADKARKGSAYTALWLFISLLIGAFVASWTATFGGRQRDL